MRFFFKGWSKRITEASMTERDGEGFPELKQGMQVDVLSMDNHLLFSAALENPTREALELRRVSGGSLPQVMGNNKIKMRGKQENEKLFFLSGEVVKSDWDHWQVEKLEILETLDSRAFFRQKADLEAKAMLGAEYYTGEKYVPCKVLDISGGGARLRTRDVYRAGDLILLEFKPVPNEPEFSIACRVRRAEQKGPEKWEYGCQFLSLVGQEQERLMRVIFDLQRKMLQSGRKPGV